MKKTLLVLAAFVLSTLPAHFFGQESVTWAFRDYSIAFPANWEPIPDKYIEELGAIQANLRCWFILEQEKLGAAGFVLKLEKEKGLPNFNSLSLKLSKKKGIKKSPGQLNLPTFSNLRLLKKGLIELNGKKTPIFLLACDTKGGEMDLLFFLISTKKAPYLVGFFAHEEVFADLVPTFQKIAASFKAG